MLFLNTSYRNTFFISSFSKQKTQDDDDDATLDSSRNLMLTDKPFFV